MPRAKSEKVEMCLGGRSFGCKHEEHPLSKKIPNIYCRRCNARMGCNWCVQIPQELVCLECHSWAHWKGEKAHGKMIPLKDAEVLVRELVDDVARKMLPIESGALEERP